MFELSCNESKWKGKSQTLLSRLRKIWNCKKFSFRDIKLLRKVARKHENEGGVDYKALEYYFPGKSADTIERQLNKIKNFY